MFSPHKQKAFSLLELLIVIALVLIVSAASVPTFSKIFESIHSKKILSELLFAINLARKEAMINMHRTHLCHSKNKIDCTGEWNDGFVLFAGKRNVYSFRNEDAEGKLFFRVFPRTRSDITYLPDGRSNYSNGTFWYCSTVEGHPLWAIVLNRRGRKRVVYPDRDNQILDSHGKKLDCHASMYLSGNVVPRLVRGI